MSQAKGKQDQEQCETQNKEESEENNKHDNKHHKGDEKRRHHHHHHSRSRNSSQSHKHRHKHHSSKSKRTSKKHSSKDRHHSSRRHKHRSRTRSPDQQYKSDKKTKPDTIKNTKSNEPDKFWDGFIWVVKTNSVANISPELLNQTRKMRRVQISNLPLYLELTEQDLSKMVEEYFIKNYQNDKGNLHPVVSSTIVQAGGYAEVELSSVEETHRIVKIGSVPIFDVPCPVTRIGEGVVQGQMLQSNMQDLVNQAQRNAQAQAAAIFAMQQINADKSDTSNVNLSLAKNAMPSFQLASSYQPPPTRIIKVSNLASLEKLLNMSFDQYEELLEEITEECNKFAQVEYSNIIQPHQADMGAQAGSVFAQFLKTEDAQLCVSKMAGRFFNENELKITFVPENIYFKFFRPLFSKPNPNQPKQNAQLIDDNKNGAI